VILAGDCREVMAGQGPFDLIIADPPYGDTALKWDKLVKGWEAVAFTCLKPTGSMWVFGSMRYFLRTGCPEGFRIAQDVVWEKPNGSGFAADRFKRVHEHAVQFYRADAAWGEVYNDVQRVAATTQNKSVRIRRQDRAAHAGGIGVVDYVDDGTRIMKSVIRAPQVRDGSHETAKPVALLETLIRTSCPPDGLVGDFFAGSGAAGEAAGLAGRRYIGAEFDPEKAARATQRLASNLFA
jgi:site-specific DNA-methyltransferase (adenine-specific)